LSFSRTLVSSIIILVVGVSLVVGLGSLAYSSVQVIVFRTGTFSNTRYYAYPVTLFTAFSVPYSTATKTSYNYYYEPGNFPGCDPVAMGCNYGFPNYEYHAYLTSTYSGLSTSFSQATMTTQSTITSTLTRTSYENIPMYTAFGLNSQFITLAMFAILLAVAVILGILLMTGRLGRSRKLNKLGPNCIKCGTELMPNAKFCGKCGTAMHDPK
jgi:ribosomal protein L40E